MNLFLIYQKPTTGLFSSVNKTEESKPEEKKPSIFGNLGQSANTTGTGLFTPGLFNSISGAPSTGLFSSIFPNSNKGFEGIAKKGKKTTTRFFFLNNNRLFFSSYYKRRTTRRRTKGCT